MTGALDRARRHLGAAPLGAVLCALLLASAPATVGGERSPQQDAPPPPEAASASILPAFSATVSRIGPKLRARMTYSHRRGCPVRLRELRYLTMTFVGFGGSARTGELVVRRTWARPVVRVLRKMYERRFPIRRMRLVDDYRGDDGLSMSANNTSAYNCRRTTSGDRWSEHAYGRAIDINPVRNPYVNGTFVAPEEGRRYARIDRSADAPYVRGAVRSSDVVVRAFRRAGWQWGGHWTRSKDYQHFSSTGR